LNKITGPEPLAHYAKDGRPHLLADHLREVGALASSFGAAFGAELWAGLAGRWHDLGKYSNDFQAMIRRENGVAAHTRDAEGGPRDHSTAGAHHALSLGQQALPLAFVIAGHHAGLADRVQLLDERLKQLRAIVKSIESDLVQTKKTRTSSALRTTERNILNTATELFYDDFAATIGVVLEDDEVARLAALELVPRRTDRRAEPSSDQPGAGGSGQGGAGASGSAGGALPVTGAAAAGKS
jgi:CRISPR-associated endonuclease Cas3-HD